MLPDVLTAVRRVDRVLPYTEGGRNFSLRCILTAITHAKALVSNVENYSTDLVYGKNPNALRNSQLDHVSFFSGNIADRVSHTSAVDTTAHSIWRGQERRRMPSNPVRPHRSMHPFFLPRTRISRILRPSAVSTLLLLHIRIYDREEDETRSISTFAKPFSSGRSFHGYFLSSGLTAGLLRTGLGEKRFSLAFIIY